MDPRTTGARPRAAARGAACAAGALLLLAAGCAERAADVELILRGGTLIDGTGSQPRAADVAVDAGRVVRVGDLSDLRGEEELDASGLVVAPGFVDMHSHADLVLLAERELQERLLEARLRQGVTTVVVGNCGLGVAPADAATGEVLAGVNGWMTPEGVSSGALGVADYLDRLEAGGVAVNVATLIPHGPVRIGAMGLTDGPPDPGQLETMRAAVRRGLEEGAFGLSTGLIYPPGMFSDTRELVRLAEVVAEFDGLFTSHVRGSSETLLKATDELVSIARASGARVHHSHLEAVGRRFWPRVADVLAREDRAREDGLRISHDVFVYTRAATMMSAIFPPWSLEGGVPALLERLRDPVVRERIRRDVEERVPEWPPWRPGGWPHNLVEAVGWDGILVASVTAGGPSEYVGRRLSDLAAEQGREPFDVVADLMIAEGGQVGQFVDEISGRDDRLDVLLSILAHPAAAVVSDAEDYGRGAPHPANAGAFARALRLNRERDLMPLQELVRRMTSYPASLVGLRDRGVVAEGRPADLVVFDAGTIADRATWSEPRAHATGVVGVLVNGRWAVKDGRYVGGLNGEVLRRTNGPGAGAGDRASRNRKPRLG
jgi:N-acyl-D-aspartate/D-glutamate deacylase